MTRPCTEDRRFADEMLNTGEQERVAPHGPLGPPLVINSAPAPSEDGLVNSRRPHGTGSRHGDPAAIGASSEPA